MSGKAKFLPIVIWILTVTSATSSAQSVARPQTNAAQGAEQSASLPPNNSLEAVANQIDLLRKSVQTLNTRLREISEKLPVPDSKQSSGANDKQSRITSNLDLLGRAEDRAGILRKHLIELIEKETTYRSRLAQLDEDIRPENVERALSGVGTTRTVELRDVRRRSLEIEKRGLESLVIVISQSRVRLEEELRQADLLCAKLRQRLFPLVEKEIDKISP